MSIPQACRDLGYQGFPSALNISQSWTTPGPTVSPTPSPRPTTGSYTFGSTLGAGVMPGFGSASGVNSSFGPGTFVNLIPNEFSGRAAQWSGTWYVTSVSFSFCSPFPAGVVPYVVLSVMLSNGTGPFPSPGFLLNPTAYTAYYAPNITKQVQTFTLSGAQLPILQGQYLGIFINGARYTKHQT